MNGTIIALDNLAIGYDGQAVLSGISLSIVRSSFTAILGANGSGKSTLLKTLLGLQPAVAGRIHIAGPVVFGYVPQSTQFDPLHLWETPSIETRFIESGAKPSGVGELGPVPTQ